MRCSLRNKCFIRLLLCWSTNNETSAPGNERNRAIQISIDLGGWYRIHIPTVSQGQFGTFTDRTWWNHRNWLFGTQMTSHWNSPTCRFWGEQILTMREYTSVWNRKSHGTATDWSIERQQPTYFRSIESRLQLDHQRRPVCTVCQESDTTSTRAHFWEPLSTTATQTINGQMSRSGQAWMPPRFWMYDIPP